MKKQKGQGSQYDRIFKENIEAVIPALMQKVLGITAIESEELPDDVLHTKERKPDFLKKITDEKGNVFILQIEFQLADEAEMVYRMAEYFIMLERKYKLPVQQYVLFIGATSPRMQIRLVRERLRFDFPLITFAELDYQLFLKSDRPEEVVLSILADFRQQNPDSIIEQIVQRVRETTEGEFALKRYFQQLRVLAQLRNLGENLKESTMESLEKYVSLEGDLVYTVTKKRMEEKFIRNLITKFTLSSEQMADAAGVSIEFVENLKSRIAAEK